MDHSGRYRLSRYKKPGRRDGVRNGADSQPSPSCFWSDEMMDLRRRSGYNRSSLDSPSLNCQCDLSFCDSCTTDINIDYDQSPKDPARPCRCRRRPRHAKWTQSYMVNDAVRDPRSIETTSNCLSGCMVLCCLILPVKDSILSFRPHVLLPGWRTCHGFRIQRQ